MLRSNSKSLGNHVVSPEEEKERLRGKDLQKKKVFKPGMKDKVGGGKLIISMTVSSINDRIRFNISYLLSGGFLCRFPTYVCVGSI